MTYSPNSEKNSLKKSKSMTLFLNKAPYLDAPTIKQIGDYIIGEEIGSGAFGKVVLGKHIMTGENVAIKILEKNILNKSPEYFDLVKQELSILKIIKHKYIVQLYEILQTQKHIFIIMEYCEGKDIMDYILKKNGLSEMESLKYFQQLINALMYLHSQNIAHRDIKIDNLLLDKNKNLKLIDFGLSTKYSNDILLNQACGTVVYAAPEVLQGYDYHGMMVDVWSSGIVLYGLLSGCLPFYDKNDEINKKLICEGNIYYPNYFNDEVKDLLSHMLEVNPLYRYTLQEIKEHSWFNKMPFYLLPGIIIGYNLIPVDESVLECCQKFNLDKNKVERSVKENKFNKYSATYYLIIKQLVKKGYQSESDLCSLQFIDFISDEKNIINPNKYFNIIDENIVEKEKENRNESKNINNLNTNEINNNSDEKENKIISTNQKDNQKKIKTEENSKVVEEKKNPKIKLIQIKKNEKLLLNSKSSSDYRNLKVKKIKISINDNNTRNNKKNINFKNSLSKTKNLNNQNQKNNKFANNPAIKFYNPSSNSSTTNFSINFIKSHDKNPFYNQKDLISNKSYQLKNKNPTNKSNLQQKIIPIKKIYDKKKNVKQCFNVTYNNFKKNEEIIPNSDNKNNNSHIYDKKKVFNTSKIEKSNCKSNSSYEKYIKNYDKSVTTKIIENFNNNKKKKLYSRSAIKRTVKNSIIVIDLYQNTQTTNNNDLSKKTNFSLTQTRNFVHNLTNEKLIINPVINLTQDNFNHFKKAQLQSLKRKFFYSKSCHNTSNNSKIPKNYKHILNLKLSKHENNTNKYKKLSKTSKNYNFLAKNKPNSKKLFLNYNDINYLTTYPRVSSIENKLDSSNYNNTGKKITLYIKTNEDENNNNINNNPIFVKTFKNLKPKNNNNFSFNKNIFNNDASLSMEKNNPKMKLTTKFKKTNFEKNLKSSVISDRYNVSTPLRNISESPGQKHLNKKIKCYRITSKLKKKEICNKLNGHKVYNKHLIKINDNPFRNNFDKDYDYQMKSRNLFNLKKINGNKLYDINLSTNNNSPATKKTSYINKIMSLNISNQNDKINLSMSNSTNLIIEDKVLDLSCLFNGFYSFNGCKESLEKKLKKNGVIYFQKKYNVFQCNKRGVKCEIEIKELNEKDYKNKDKIYLYRIISKDKESNINNIRKIYSKIIFGN